MYKDLDHLDDDKVNELMDRYYSGEKAKVLKEEYALDVKVSDLYKLFPLQIFNEFECKYCKIPVVTERRSQSWMKYGYLNYYLFCPECGHKPFDKCNCINCEYAKLNSKKRQREMINELFGIEPIKLEFQNLSFIQKVYLGAFCRAYLQEDILVLGPIDKMNEVLAPNDPFKVEICEELMSAGVLSVSPQSHLDAFEFDENNQLKAYTFDKVEFNLNIVGIENNQELILDILDPTYYKPEDQYVALDLWRKIAVNECVEYLQYSLKEVGFDFVAGKKTYLTFEILLNDFSVSQIYGIIYKSVADASRLCLKGLSRRHAANSVIGLCQRYAERSKLNQWDLVKFKRNIKPQQSELSLFFFNRVLKIGDNGFDMPPVIDNVGLKLDKELDYET